MWHPVFFFAVAIVRARAARCLGGLAHKHWSESGTLEVATAAVRLPDRPQNKNYFMQTFTPKNTRVVSKALPSFKAPTGM